MYLNGSDHLIAYNRIHGVKAGSGSQGCSSGWRYSTYIYYGDESTGRSGGRGIGISVNGTEHTLIGNEIYDIEGGRAGDGQSSYNRSRGNTTYHPGGTGGEAIGILLQGEEHQLERNLIRDLIGGEGGDPPNSSVQKGKSGSEIGIWLTTFNHTIRDSNTVESEPIIYSYGESDKQISGYILTRPVMTTNLGKIVIINGERIKVQDNHIANVGPFHNGPKIYVPVYQVYAVWIEDSVSIELKNNQVNHIRGGDDFLGQITPGYALYIRNAPSTLLVNNSISDVRGGTSNGGESDGYLVYLEQSDNSKIYQNELSDIKGTGLQLIASQNVSFEGNLMHSFLGGTALKITEGPHQTKFKNNTLDLSGTATGVNLDGDCGIAIENSMIINAGSWAATRSEADGPLELRLSYSLLWNNANDVQNGNQGEGMIYADPLFISTSPYTLREDSPTINAGPPLWVCDQEPLSDEGQCRIDMGHFANTPQAQ